MVSSRFQIERKKALTIIFVTTFILSYSSAIVSYVNSTFLGTLMSERIVGIVFMVSYFISTVLVNYYARIIKNFTNYKTFLVVLLINAFALLALPFLNNVLVLALVFILFISSYILLWISLDIFIHGFSLHCDVGRVRGINMTLMNLGWITGPMTAGFLIAKIGYTAVYVLASSLVFVVIFIVLTSYRGVKGKVHDYKIANVAKLIKQVRNRVELRDIFAIALVLQIFYGIMVIYTPIYLISRGFSFTEMGLMFAIMLLPFVIFEFPAGYLADKYFGETEMITLGLLIMGFSTVSMFFVSGFWGFAIVLFLTRTGASMVEVLRDSYFYKVINTSDIDLINFFRSTGPIGHIIAPIIGTVIISFLPMAYLYLVLGIIVIGGLFFTMRMPDTK